MQFIQSLFFFLDCKTVAGPRPGKNILIALGQAISDYNNWTKTLSELLFPLNDKVSNKIKIVKLK